MNNDVIRYEAEKQTTQEYIDFMYECLETYPAISHVIDSFNGKVFNKRFYKALESVPAVRGYTTYYGAIQIYRNFECKCNNSYHHREYHFFWYQKKDLPDNKRIDSATWNDQLKHNMILLYKDIKKAEAALANIDYYLDQYKLIQSMLEATNKEIPWFMSDIFNCHYRLYNR